MTYERFLLDEARMKGNDYGPEDVAGPPIRSSRSSSPKSRTLYQIRPNAWLTVSTKIGVEAR
jgi:hypothetical protein